MSFHSLPLEVRAIAERELTRKQLDVLKLRLGEMSFRDIALALDIGLSTAYDRYVRALQLIRLATEKIEREAA